MPAQLPAAKHTVSAASLFSRFRKNPGEIARACRACPDYGHFWTCPPFRPESSDRIFGWEYASLYLFRIDVPREIRCSPRNKAFGWLAGVKKDIDSFLLSEEKRSGGMACSICGACSHCDVCTRSETDTLPCRHPGIARAPLEAFGFNVSDILAEIFGIVPIWPTPPDTLPPRLSFVAAIFHNTF